jgi:hypothetical protein
MEDEECKVGIEDEEGTVVIPPVNSETGGKAQRCGYHRKKEHLYSSMRLAGVRKRKRVGIPLSESSLGELGEGAGRGNAGKYRGERPTEQCSSQV